MIEVEVLEVDETVSEVVLSAVRRWVVSDVGLDCCHVLLQVVDWVSDLLIGGIVADQSLQNGVAIQQKSLDLVERNHYLLVVVMIEQPQPVLDVFLLPLTAQLTVSDDRVGLNSLQDVFQ